MYGQMMRLCVPRKVRASEGTYEGKGPKKRGRVTGRLAALTGTPSWPVHACRQALQFVLE